MQRRAEQLVQTPEGSSRTRPEGRGSSRSAPHAGRFTLLETLITLLITGIVSILLMQSLVTTSTRTQTEFRDRVMQNTARMALARVTKDLQSLGVDTFEDLSTGVRQPKLIYAGPYQIVFNADLDATRSRDPNAPLLGAIHVGEANDQVGETSLGELLYDPNETFLDPNETNPRRGAETIRIGLDTNFDGDISPGEDDENDFWANATDLWGGLDLSRFASPNPKDAVLLREVYGWDPDAGTSGENVRTWELLAVGLHPWLDESYLYPGSEPSTLDPDEAPPLLFEYWAYLCKEPNPSILDPNDPPEIPKECLFRDIDLDGKINATELEMWIDEGGTWSESSDDNADGVINQSLDEVLSRIVVTINVESPIAATKMPNLLRTDLDRSGTIDAGEVPYYYKDVMLRQNVVPVNIRLRGTNTQGF